MSSLPRRTEKAEASRRRILDAAARLFREHGYGSVSMRSIAAAAGMKAGSVYYHFASKQDIVVEILDIGICAVREEVGRTLEKLPATASATDTIRAGMLAHLRALFEFSDYTSANVRIYADVPDPVRQANLEVRRDYEAMWDRLLENLAERHEVRGDVDLRSLKLLLLGSLNATLEWFDTKRGNLPEVADSYADILLNGLLPHAERGQ